MSSHKIFQDLEQDIEHSNLADPEKKKLFQNLLALKHEQLNIMITGATGAGKSSTINALFDTNVAKVGTSADPETMTITKYELGNMILWDSPGLGDGKEKDNQHAKAIIKKLNELDANGKPIIDLVLVIIDGSTRDLGTTYELINSVIIPQLGTSAEKRLLVAMNQADVAMKGRKVWDEDNNKPTEKARVFLKDKIASIQARIKEATKVSIDPIYYCAGYKEDDDEQRPYNLSKLMYLIVTNTPSEKRLLLADTMSKEDEIWQDDDELKDYSKEIRSSFAEAVIEGARKGSEIGADIGRMFGRTGEAIGSLAGGVIGGIASGIGSLLGF